VRYPNGLRRSHRAVLAIVIALAATVTPASASRTGNTFGVGTGLKLKTIRDTKGPQEIRVLTLSPGSSVPDIAPATQHYPMWSLTSTMSSQIGAIAGVNGDFGTSQGQPKHTLMIDGELWTSGQAGGNAIGWSANGKVAFIGHPKLKIAGHDVTHASDFFISDWNVGAPRRGQIAGYTTRGGDVTKPPGKVNPSGGDPHWCAARLVPSRPTAWNSSRQTSLVRRYTVEAQPEPCPKTPLGFGSDTSAVVIAAKASVRRAAKIVGLQPGDSIRVSWTLRGWPHVTDVMGAQQMLVNKGNNVAPAYHPGDDYIFNYNPRTSMGISKGCSDTDGGTGCRMFLVTVDGRQTSSNWSRGYRLPSLAAEQIRAGAWKAVNLDGGGSTAMWVKKKDRRWCESSPNAGGCLANRPSPSSGERATRSAIVVLPTTDTGTPQQLR
jgi:exopolysaccharide biosynthesis protein